MNDGEQAAIPTIGIGGKDDYRLLRKLQLAEGPTGQGDRSKDEVAVVIDVETTGLAPGQDQVIEIAMRRFRFDSAGVITAIDRPYGWLEDPGVPLAEDIAKLTGLSDAQLAGQQIDDGAAMRVLRSARICIAHNAGFDRKFVECRLPDAAGLPWACSCTGIDWPNRGFDGRGLGWLLAQTGYFHDGHRAQADVDATIALLRHKFDDGSTALSDLVARAMRPSWIVQAIGAAFDRKDVLRSRGYRWDAEAKAWWREVTHERRIPEEFWLAATIYSVDANPRALGPRWIELDRFTRFLR